MGKKRINQNTKQIKTKHKHLKKKKEKKVSILIFHMRLGPCDS
jgi:hypothetical protein